MEYRQSVQQEKVDLLIATIPEIIPRNIAKYLIKKPIWILAALLAEFPLTIAIAYLLDAVGVPGGYLDHQTPSEQFWFAIYAVLGAPLLETMIMILVLKFCRRFSQQFIVQAMMCSIILAALHSLSGWGWGLRVVCGFFVYSVTLLFWRKVSTTTGVIMTTLIHATSNLIVASIIAFS